LKSNRKVFSSSAFSKPQEIDETSCPWV